MLWHAAVGALVVGVLMRWWGRVWVRQFQEALEQRALQAAAVPPTPAVVNPLKKK